MADFKEAAAIMSTTTSIHEYFIFLKPEVSNFLDNASNLKARKIIGAECCIFDINCLNIANQFEIFIKLKEN